MFTGSIVILYSHVCLLQNLNNFFLALLGPTHDFTAAAERMLEVCRKSLVDVSVTPTTSVQGCGDLVLC